MSIIRSKKLVHDIILQYETSQLSTHIIKVILFVLALLFAKQLSLIYMLENQSNTTRNYYLLDKILLDKQNFVG